MTVEVAPLTIVTDTSAARVLRKRVTSIVAHALLIGASILMLYPLLWMLSASFRPESEIFTANSEIRRIKMSIIWGATIAVAMLALVSNSSVHARDSAAVAISPELGINDPGSTHRGDADVAAITPLSRQAPVGHRQPRVIDVPSASQLSPIELDMRREDELIDGKLTICRGC